MPIGLTISGTFLNRANTTLTIWHKCEIRVKVQVKVKVGQGTYIVAKRRSFKYTQNSFQKILRAPAHLSPSTTDQDLPHNWDHVAVISVRVRRCWYCGIPVAIYCWLSKLLVTRVLNTPLEASKFKLIVCILWTQCGAQNSIGRIYPRVG